MRWHPDDAGYWLDQAISVLEGLRKYLDPAGRGRAELVKLAKSELVRGQIKLVLTYVKRATGGK